MLSKLWLPTSFERPVTHRGIPVQPGLRLYACYFGVDFRKIIMADEECLLDDPLSVAERKFKLFAQTKLFKAEVSIEASKD